MEDQAFLGYEPFVNVGRDEEEEDEFCSCCEDEEEREQQLEEEWKETEETVVVEGLKEELDEFSVRMYFKGLSIAGVENSTTGFSGIGVYMERSSSFSPIRVQKRLDFYAEEPMVDYLALMDGLLEALQNKILRVYAFTDSELLYKVSGAVINPNISLFCHIYNIVHKFMKILTNPRLAKLNSCA